MLTSLSQYTRTNIIMDVVGIEGGYSNDPVDNGGRTNYGITEAAAMRRKADLQRLFQWDGDMRHLTTAMAVWIYVQDYWNPISGDGIVSLGGKAPLLACLLFEAGVNMGPKVVGTYYQNVLNVLNQQATLYPDLLVDGNLGPKSVGSLQLLMAKRPSDGLKNAIFLINCEVGHQYTAISLQTESQERFTSGWANRARGYMELLSSLY